MPISVWPRRYTLVALTVFAVFICYVDRVVISVTVIPMAKQLGWGYEVQGRIQAAFFVGYLLTQIISGKLADRHGGKAVLGVGLLICSLFTILSPPAAFLGLSVLIAARIAAGMGQAVMFPSFHSLYARWIPTQERTRAVAKSNCGIPLGTAAALLMTPIIVDHWGWSWAFYLYGGLGVVWFVGWQTRITAVPADHPSISAEELEHIRANAPTQEVAESPPWREFLRSMPVWAIIVAHFCNNWSLYVLLTWLPTFVTEGLGVDFKSVGMVSMIPHLVSFIFLNVAGNVADRLISGGMDVGRTRKLMQAIGFGGISISLLIVSQVSSVWMAIAVMSAGKALGAFSTGGFSVNHMDVAPRYAGLLFGITNTAGTIPGIVGVYVTGLILEATGSWAVVWNTTAGVTIFGLVFYLVFSSGKKQFD